MEENNILQNLVFKVGSSLFMTSVKKVRYIGAIPKKITVIPHSPKFVRGFCDYEGDSITMVDLCEILFGYTPNDEKYFFTVDQYGFIVNEVISIETTGEFEQSQTCSGAKFVAGVYTMSNSIYKKYCAHTNSNAVFVPDFESILLLVKHK